MYMCKPQGQLLSLNPSFSSYYNTQCLLLLDSDGIKTEFWPIKQICIISMYAGLPESLRDTIIEHSMWFPKFNQGIEGSMMDQFESGFRF